MLHLRSRASLGLLVLTLAAHVPARAQAAAAPPAPTPPTTDARQLLAIARGALTAAAQAATGPLGPGQAAGRPLWTAIDAMGRSLDAVGTTFAAKSPTFFDALSTGSRALAELRAVWAHAGVDNPGVRSGLETLSSSYQLLRGSYGWEALRQFQGGPLTADEGRRFQAMQQAEAALAARLLSLRQQAARVGDAQAAADLSRLAAQARGMAQAERSLAAYLAAQMAAVTLQGEWAGDSRAVKPATKKVWKQAAPLVEDLTTGTDVGFVFTSDLSKVDAWAPLEAAVEVPGGVDLGMGEAAAPVVSTASAGALVALAEADEGDLDSLDPGTVGGTVGNTDSDTDRDTDGNTDGNTDGKTAKNTDGKTAETRVEGEAPTPTLTPPAPPPLDRLLAFALLGHLLG